MTIEKDFPDKQDPRYYYKQTLRPEKQIREPNTITKYYGRHDTGNRCKVCLLYTSPSPRDDR